MKRFYRKRIYLEASFTVEAALLIPIVIIALISLFWAVFYLHNSIKAEADFDMNVYALEREAAEKKKISDDIYRDVTGEFEGYYGAEVKKAVFRFDGSDITGSMILKQNIPDEGLIGRMLEPFSGIEMEKEISVSDKAEILRIIKAASELLGNLVDTYKNSRQKG